MTAAVCAVAAAAGIGYAVLPSGPAHVAALQAAPDHQGGGGHPAERKPLPDAEPKPEPDSHAPSLADRAREEAPHLDAPGGDRGCPG